MEINNYTKHNPQHNHYIKSTITQKQRKLPVPSGEKTAQLVRSYHRRNYAFIQRSTINKIKTAHYNFQYPTEDDRIRLLLRPNGRVSLSLRTFIHEFNFFS